MNKRAKQRLIGVTILILVVVGVLFFFMTQSGGVATPVTIDELLSDQELVGQQIEVTGKVVAGSWVSGAKPFVFEIEDDESDGRVTVVWNNVVPGSFGDGTSATVTGTMNGDGAIEADYLVTKCPSKYESATGALTVNDVLGRTSELEGVTVKVTGFVVADSIGEPGAPVRFQIADKKEGGTPLDVSFGGGLSEEFVDGAKVVITGSIESDGVFECAEVALDQSAR